MTSIAIGVHQVKNCDDCGATVAWTQSKDGAWFLAKVTQRWGAGLQVHTHDPHAPVCKGKALNQGQQIDAMLADPAISDESKAKLLQIQELLAGKEN